MFKDILLEALAEIKRREERKQDLMKDCVEAKLDRSLRNYEVNLKETCNLLLSRNPISIIKGINKEFAEEEKETNEDEM